MALAGRPVNQLSGDLLQRPTFRYSWAMSESKDERQARLAQALRNNLRRRKAQARAGDTPPPPEDKPGDEE